tara:strand:- start:79 stop:636 length:558 start_codon:yes stop_codon:yes gene_type:complete
MTTLTSLEGGRKRRKKKKTNNARGYSKVAVKNMYKKTKKKARKKGVRIRSPSLLRIKKKYQSYMANKTRNRKPSGLRKNTTHIVLATIKRNATRKQRQSTSHWNNWNTLLTKPEPKKKKSISIRRPSMSFTSSSERKSTSKKRSKKKSKKKFSIRSIKNFVSTKMGRSKPSKPSNQSYGSKMRRL